MRTSIPRRLRLDSPRRSPEARAAFSLIELLVTLVVFLLILVPFFTFTTSTEQAWKTASSDPYAEAEDAFETIVHQVESATLETYQDYADANGSFRTNSTASFTSDHLARRSDLAFVCGQSSGTTGWLGGSGRVTTKNCLFFVAPQGYTQSEAHLGLAHLLNAQGFFLEFSDEGNAPSFVSIASHRWRWRLKEIVQPSEALGIYSASASLPWVQALVQPGASLSILAENVVALLVLPDTTPSNYNYDSRDAGNPLTRNQLPARLRLVLVAIDEASSQILAAQNGAQPPPLIPASSFTDATKIDSDLASLDSSLTTNQIRHRIFQREIVLPSAAWSQALSQ